MIRFFFIVSCVAMRRYITVELLVQTLSQNDVPARSLGKLVQNDRQRTPSNAGSRKRSTPLIYGSARKKSRWVYVLQVTEIGSPGVLGLTQLESRPATVEDSGISC